MLDYTKEIHKGRLRAMIQKLGDAEANSLQDNCPAAKHLSAAFFPGISSRDESASKYLVLDPTTDRTIPEACVVCREFVMTKAEKLEMREFPHTKCPCDVLGCESALLRTVQRLRDEPFESRIRRNK